MAPTGGTKVTPRQFLQEKSSSALTRATFLKRILRSPMIAEVKMACATSRSFMGQDVACLLYATTGAATILRFKHL